MISLRLYLVTMRNLLTSIIILGTLCAPIQSYANDREFIVWTQHFKREAIKQGISSQTADAAFNNIKYLENVIKLDRKQPENQINFKTYITKVITKDRIQKAQELYQENKTLLDKIGKEFGVQPRFIVALWGIESNFGKNMGGFNIIDALATLAYEGRRKEFFSKELVYALRILDQRHISLNEFKGSWAGAMGQIQFMPSSFHHYAVDYNHDGRKDIWGTKEDCFASIANYLKTEGWNDNLTWGRSVNIPHDLDKNLVSSKEHKPLTSWASLGIKQRDGASLPKASIDASLVRPGKDERYYYLVYPNYHTILHWNKSLYFATAVGILSDHIIHNRVEL